MMNLPTADYLAAQRVAFGDRIRELRIGCDLSQQQLADGIGIHRVTVTNLETGQHNPGLDTIFKLASFFQIPVGSLFEN